jgi:hypothetical protein
MTKMQTQKMHVRLAMRHEGKWWNAYLAKPDTMEGALHLGSIRMTLVDNEEAKTAFLDAMKIAMTVAGKEAIGVEMQWPNPPQPAPESERSGHS